jgi:CheY-like chemotaxis protein
MKRILLLEDNSGVVDVLTMILEEAGYYGSATTRANDAKQMLERS